MTVNFFEKLASDLEKAADFIERIEGQETTAKVAEESAKVKEAEDKRKAIIAPIKEKLSNITDENEIEEKLKTASVEALELISKGFNSDSKVEDSWGNVEVNKGGKGKFAGYRDPLEAFAMGD
jgi:lysyl-tRNA synthetase class I